MLLAANSLYRVPLSIAFVVPNSAEDERRGSGVQTCVAMCLRVFGLARTVRQTPTPYFQAGQCREEGRRDPKAMLNRDARSAAWGNALQNDGPGRDVSDKADLLSQSDRPERNCEMGRGS
jgi:hypothetical protein